MMHNASTHGGSCAYDVFGFLFYSLLSKLGVGYPACLRYALIHDLVVLILANLLHERNARNVTARLSKG